MRAPGSGAVLFTGLAVLPTKARFEWQQEAHVEALLETDWSPAADVLAALGHPVRLVLLREVLRGAQTVGELGALEALGTSRQIYHHLRQLVRMVRQRPTSPGDRRQARDRLPARNRAVRGHHHAIR